jgi:hypothetical protein
MEERRVRREEEGRRQVGVGSNGKRGREEGRRVGREEAGG